MTERRIQVLVIEDDIDFFDIIRLCLEEPDSMGMKFDLERADRLETGLKLLESARFDAVLLDLTLPDSRGIDTVVRVISKGYETPILVMTSLGDESTAFEALRLGAQDYLVKATSDSRLLKRSIWYAIERQRLLSQTEAMIKKAADGMIVVDEEGAVQYVNPAAEALFGQKAAEILGRPFAHSAAPGEAAVLKLSDASGKEMSAEMRVAEITWKGRPARLASIRDITELQRVEQLKAEIKERRRIDELKDDLISTVSHELRTPLTIVKGAIDNLREGIAGPMPPKQREIVSVADRNLRRLAKMINNLLDLSRLESGRAKASRRRLNLASLIGEIVQDHGPSAAERKIELSADLSPGLPDIHADPELLAQVLTNLLDNALRFARARVSLKAHPADGPGVLIEVVDDGPGMPADKIKDLFNKFVQLNRPAGGSGYKGSGLGLAICQEIMALHDSQIQVSCTGAETRFSFGLPVFAAQGAASTHQD